MFSFTICLFRICFTRSMVTTKTSLWVVTWTKLNVQRPSCWPNAVVSLLMWAVVWMQLSLQHFSCWPHYIVDQIPPLFCRLEQWCSTSNGFLVDLVLLFYRCEHRRGCRFLFFLRLLTKFYWLSNAVRVVLCWS